MSTLRKELDNLKMTDTFSLILFVLYKIRDVDEYSTLSELAYILDKDALLNLCEYFGGLTIRVPKIEELDSIINSLLLYQYINIDGYSYKDAIEKIGFDSFQLRKIKKDYNNICSILDKYSWS